MKTLLSALSLAGVLAGPVLAADAPPAKAPAVNAAELYQAKCQACHMADGNSPIEDMNFADGKWKHGSKPAEVVATITEGAPGTAMLPFKEQLTAAEIKALAAYVRAFDKSLAPAKKGK
jgi:mono/diheme cytochrome c family protein